MAEERKNPDPAFARSTVSVLLNNNGFLELSTTSRSDRKSASFPPINKEVCLYLNGSSTDPEYGRFWMLESPKQGGFS